MDLDRWHETIASHINGTFHAARFAASHMIAAGGGSNINMSSTAGDASHESTGNVAYSVAKAGVEQLTRGFARELVSANVAVNASRLMAQLSEGSSKSANWLTRYRVKTEAKAAQGDISDEKLMNKFSSPSAIVPSIVYLAQQRSYFTGNVVHRTEFNGDGFSTVVWPPQDRAGIR